MNDELGVSIGQEAGQLLGVVSGLCLRQVVQLIHIVKQLTAWDGAQTQCTQQTRVGEESKIVCAVKQLIA